MIKFIMNLFRFAVTIALVGVCGYLVYDFVDKQKERSAYNETIEMVNRGELKESVDPLKKFMDSSDSAIASNAKSELIKLYKRLGDDPGNPTKKSAHYYQLALSLDPDCLNDMQKRLVEADRKFNHK